MGNISQIKFEGVLHNIVDAQLTEQVEKLDKISASAFNNINDRVISNDNRITTVESNIDLDVLTDEELEEIMSIMGYATNIYTDEFSEDFTLEDFAGDQGMSISELLDAFPDDCMSFGSQKLVNTEETFEYDGANYLMYEVFAVSSGDKWVSTEIYALLPANIYLQTLVNNSMKQDQTKMYQPFIATVQSDDISYEDAEGLIKYTVIYAE